MATFISKLKECLSLPDTAQQLLEQVQRLESNIAGSLQKFEKFEKTAEARTQALLQIIDLLNIRTAAIGHQPVRGVPSSPLPASSLDHSVQQKDSPPKPTVQLSAPLRADQRYLIITHSDRPAALDHCDLNYLELRYASPDRLPAKIPFEDLQPSNIHSPYGGEISIYQLVSDHKPELVGRFRPNAYKPQHAAWHAGRLWVLGAEHLEVYDSQLNSVARIHDPWLAGGHTVIPDGNGRVLLSCSSSDSVLVVNTETMQIVAAHRVPESLYGSNYQLTRKHSVVDHYITNDLQIAHLNGAAPWRGGILASSLIPGAIGWFAPDGHYSELLRGFVGLHGVRVADSGDIYFSDSCNGMLIFAEFRNSALSIKRRIKVPSLWLHDAVQISGDMYALALFDRNHVMLYDTANRSVVGTIDCGTNGGPQFLAY